MSDDRGLLGSLPKTRPGVESPRRAAAREKAARDAPETPTEPAAAAEAHRPSGFEDLARAGIGLAGGAAALGLRLAGQAAGEIGKAVGRR
jgi:hypothetical protein